MDQEIRSNGPINCACVIHGSFYSWDYVDKLYSMLSRHLSQPVQLHVYTEPDRKVPAHMIKHGLSSLNTLTRQRSWWYKLEMFNPEHYTGPLLYFDLDVVITGNIDWIVQQPVDYFWTLRDFKRLWRPQYTGINSSVMWWDTGRFSFIWDDFKSRDFSYLQRQYRGDQDFLNDVVDQSQFKFLDESRIRSWRWECLDGGWDFKRRRYRQPGSGTALNGTDVLVFHGQPNPADVQDPVILEHWR